MSNISLKEAAEIFVGKENILLLCHVRPDGDTLGSAFGLKKALEATGKHKVTVVCSDEVPKRLGFITDMDFDLSPEKCRGEKFDLISAIDVAETDLLGEKLRKYSDRIDLKLDHHYSGSEYAKYNYIKGDASAAGEIIYELIKELEELGEGKLTPSSSTALFAAIASDTGSFQYSNVKGDTLRIAGALVDAGAENSEVCYRLFAVRTVNEVLAQKITLNNLNIYRSGTMAVITITNEMKTENGLCDEDFGGIASYLREIEGIELAITIKQTDDDPNKYKISMRSGATVNSSELCRMFGGGGHERAAGATVTADSPENAEYKVTEGVQSVIGYV